MAKMELQDSTRKALSRSTTWNSLSAPPSPRISPHSTVEEAFPLLSQPLTSKDCASWPSRPPLQPLSISRRSKESWPTVAFDDSASWDISATPGRRRIKCTPPVKLDLSSLPRKLTESTEIQRKRDKFAFFEKECSRITEHVYLGSDSVAKNRATLRASGITHVLNCVGFVCPEYFKKDLIYKTLWLQDSPCEDITSLLYDVFDYFEEVREQGGRVFVHCCQGVSRSTSFVIAYLMWRDGRSFEDAFQDVKAARGITNPNMGFACQLLQCQKRVHAAPMSPNSVLRMYRLAPHSHYQPLHLVPKMINNPGSTSLDSRGAFVIQVPNAIYIWIGQICNHRIAHAARGAADQVIRYERVEGPVLLCTEGEEHPEFWDALSKCPFVKDSDITDDISRKDNCNAEGRCKVENEDVERVKNVGLGLKRVAGFDVDYELYQLASQGGVIPPVPSSCVEALAIPTRVPVREDGWSRLRRKFPWGKGLVAAAKTAGGSANVEASLSNCKNLVPSIPSLPILTGQNQEINGGHSPDTCMSPASFRSSVTSISFSSDSASPSSLLDWSPSSSSETPSPPLNHCRLPPSFVDNDLPLLNTGCRPQFTFKGSSASLAERRNHASLDLGAEISPSDSRRISQTNLEGLNRLITDVSNEKGEHKVGNEEYMSLAPPVVQQLKGLNMQHSGVEHVVDLVSMECQYEPEIFFQSFSLTDPEGELTFSYPRI